MASEVVPGRWKTSRNIMIPMKNIPVVKDYRIITLVSVGYTLYEDSEV